MHVPLLCQTIKCSASALFCIKSTIMNTDRKEKKEHPVLDLYYSWHKICNKIKWDVMYICKNINRLPTLIFNKQHKSNVKQLFVNTKLTISACIGFNRKSSSHQILQYTSNSLDYFISECYHLCKSSSLADCCSGEFRVSLNVFPKQNNIKDIDIASERELLLPVILKRIIR